MIRKVLALGVLLGVVASATLTWQDFVMQNAYRDVLLVLDYSAVHNWAEHMGQDETELLSVAKENGIKTLALNERELYTLNKQVFGFFEEDPDLIAATGLQILKNEAMMKGKTIWSEIVAAGIKEESIYLYSAEKSKGLQLQQDATHKYGADRVTSFNLDSEADGHIFRIDQTSAQPIHGLGFDAQMVDKLQTLGFELIPRFENYSLTVADEALLSNYLQNVLDETRPPLLIFAGMNGILGSPYQGQGANLLNITAESLQQEDKQVKPLYGYIEMTKLEGDTALARELSYHLARVHSISLDEWQGRYNRANADWKTISNAVERYMLAVNDRSVHALYLRPFSQPLDFNNTFFATLTSELNQRAYLTGAVSALPGKEALPPLALILIGIGAGCAFLLLIDLMFHWKTVWLGALLAIGSCTVAGIVSLMPHLNILLQKGIALGSALVFPLLAIQLAFGLGKQRPISKTHGVVRRMLNGFVILIAVTFMGALYVHGSLATKPFMTAINVFPAVKIALLAPVLFVPVLYWWQEKRQPNHLIKFIMSSVRIYQILLGGIALVALALLLMRSGNNPLLGVSSIELKMRLFLQDILIARPRNKEFAVGYPLLLLALYMNAKGHKTFLWLVLTGGVIGLASFINTFAHLHKPVWMALLTSFNGLWLGCLFGLVLIVLYKWLYPWLRHVMEGDKS